VIRLSAAERYDADGNLTPAGKAEWSRQNRDAIIGLFQRGDVVWGEHLPDRLGIVTDTGDASLPTLDIAFEDGSMGSLCEVTTWHREPRVNVPVPKGALGHRWWNRQQAVKATLRRAGLR
jgi:hypothetical protein